MCNLPSQIHEHSDEVAKEERNRKQPNLKMCLNTPLTVRLKTE